MNCLRDGVKALIYNNIISIIVTCNTKDFFNTKTIMGSISMTSVRIG